MLDKRVGKFIAIEHSRDNTEIPILYILFYFTFSFNHHVLRTRFITDDFADFCSKISFITNVQLFLLYRNILCTKI